MHKGTATILLLLTLTTLVTAAGPPAEPQDALEQAKQLADAGQYEQAEQLYQAILAEQPSGDQALAAQKELAILYVRSGQGTEAKQALEDLIAGFSDHWDIARAVTHVADASRETGKHNDALETYGRVIAAWPDDEHALWSQMGIAISQACLKDAKASDAAVEDLCSTWQGHHHLGRALCIVADNSRRLNSHEKARDTYNRALASNPDPEFAMWSRMGLAISEVRLGDYASANAAVEKMLEDSFEDERMAVAACLVADEYRARQVHQVACVLYQYVIDNWPQAEHAMWSRMGLAVSNTALGNENDAQTAAEGMVDEFSGHKDIALAIQQMVQQYRSLGAHEQAEYIHEYVGAALAELPQADQRMWSRIAKLASNIAIGNEPNVQATIDQLIADFDGHPDLPAAIFQIADQYYSNALLCENQDLDAEATYNLARVINICQRVINEFPVSHPAAAEAHDITAICYTRLGEHATAIEYYQKLVDNWPDYKYVWNAQFLIGHMCKRLVHAGIVEKSEGLARTKAAYEQLLQRHPNCPAAKAARDWLQHNAKSIEGG